MKYDFTSIIDRCGKDAICIEGLGAPGGFAPGKPKDGFDVIPMWIADMNFPTCPTVIEAMLERIKHPIYGYFPTRSEYYDSIIQWHSKRNGVVGLEKKHIGYENGVLGGLISALNSIAARGDKILVHSPTYIGFTRSLSNNGYRLVLSPLVKDENSIYRMDFADMEEKIVKEGITTALLCSPHNYTAIYAVTFKECGYRVIYHRLATYKHFLLGYIAAHPATDTGGKNNGVCCIFTHFNIVYVFL